ncbi:MAG: hypothetical protein UHX00_15130 [Caryophanon sp.]|nr:hypothetical protein [Caryophanon sp.]
MKAKTIMAYSERGFDKKMNEFLTNTSIEVIEIQYSATLFGFTALILYK